MVMNWKTIPIQMNGGVDQKTDSKQVVPGRWLTLQNVEMLKSGRFKKRTGFSASINPAVSGTSCFGIVGQEILPLPLSTDAKIQIEKSKSFGVFSKNPVISRGLAANTDVIYYALDGGSTTTFTLAVTDGSSTTKADTLLKTQYSVLKPLLGGSQPGLLLQNVKAGPSGDLQIRSGVSGSLFLTVAAGIDLSGGRLSEYAGNNTNFTYFAYASGANNITVARFALGTVSIDATATIVDAASIPHVFADSTYVWVGHGTVLTRYALDLTGPVNQSFSDTIVSVSKDGYVLTRRLVANVYYYGLYNSSAVLQKEWAVGDGAVTATSFFGETIELLGANYVTSIDQTAGALLLSSTQEALEAYFGNCSGITRLSSTAIAYKIIKDVRGYYDFNVHTVSTVIRSNSITVNGSILYSCGNIRVRESGSNVSTIYGICSIPKIGTISQGAATGTPIYVAGEYQVLALYSRVNAQGNIVRSVPSIAATFTVTAADLDKPRTFSIYSRMTDSNIDDNMQIEVYLSEVNSSAFSRTNVYKKAALVSASAGIQDATTIALYTTAGILEDLPSPAILGAISLVKNRFWCFSAEKTIVCFSDKINFNEQAGFNESLTLRLPDIDGPGVVASEMDGKIVVFQETCMSATFGDGPSETGANEFPDLQMINTDLGCLSTAPKSVQVVDDGLMFASKKGIWLLNRNLGFDYIGAPVEDDAPNVVTACLPTTKDQVIFAALTKLLVWDCFHKLWSTQPLTTIANAICADIFNNNVVLLSLGQTYTQDTTLDVGSSYSITAKTGWLSLSGLEGYERIRRIMFLCDQVTASTLTVTLRYNFIPTVAETFTISTATIVDTGNNVQWIMRPKIQKCESVQIEITSTGSFDLSGFVIEAGGKSGLFRTSATKKIQGV